LRFFLPVPSGFAIGFSAAKIEYYFF